MQANPQRRWKQPVQASRDVRTTSGFCGPTLGCSTIRPNRSWRTTSGSVSPIPRWPTASRLACENSQRWQRHSERTRRFPRCCALPERFPAIGQISWLLRNGRASTDFRPRTGRPSSPTTAIGSTACSAGSCERSLGKQHLRRQKVVETLNRSVGGSRSWSKRSQTIRTTSGSITTSARST